jgi:hypothetical protein
MLDHLLSSFLQTKWELNSSFSLSEPINIRPCYIRQNLLKLSSAVRMVQQ